MNSPPFFEIIIDHISIKVGTLNVKWRIMWLIRSR